MQPGHRITPQLALACCLVIAAAAAATPAQENPRHYRQAARECRRGAGALERGDLDRARRHFDEALELIPGLAEAHLGLGHLSMRTSRWDQALLHYQKARDGFVDAVERRNADEFRRYFDTQMRAQVLRDELTQLQNNPNLKISDGQRAIMVAEREAALDRARQTPQPGRGEEPRVPAEVYFLIGNAQFRLDRVDEARASWEECARIDPDFPPVYNNLAVAYYKAGRLADARFSLQRAAQLGAPVHPELKRLIGENERSRPAGL